MTALLATNQPYSCAQDSMFYWPGGMADLDLTCAQSVVGTVHAAGKDVRDVCAGHGGSAGSSG